jgi:hypothetical protein
VAAVLYGPVIGYLASLLVSLYLLVASWFGVNVNELFAGQGIEHGKSFLRLHVAPDGTLTIYPIGLDRICKKWEAAPEAPADAPWLRPTQPLRTHLIEGPIVIAPAPAAVPRRRAAAADRGRPVQGGAAADAGRPVEGGAAADAGLG